MEVFDLIPYPNETLTFVLRELTSARDVVFSGNMSVMPGFGEYSVTIDIPVDVAPGNYKSEIVNDAGGYRKIGYMRIVSDVEYHFVNDFGDFNREPSAQDIEDQLEDEFIQAQNPEFEVG